jgi:hypothetical protein
MLPPISSEQNEILDKLVDNNIIVDAVAGSGKTTTSIYIAKKFSKMKILLLTYNKRLKIETRERILKNNVENMECHSYHAFCVRYYNEKTYTDSPIKTLIEDNLKPKNSFDFDIIILDEAQDTTPLYYNLFCKIYYDNIKNAKLCIMGDKYQCIFQFNNADNRFLIYADKLFNFNDLPWVRTTLSTSYRVTNQIADFVNQCLLSDIENNRIKAIKDNDKVRYIICDTFDRDFIKKEIDFYVEQDYKYDEIFVLAPSVKNANSDKLSPCVALSNYLSDFKNIPIYVTLNDKEDVNENEANGKLVISTFHQVKGLERKVVIVFNFDQSYFDYYSKNSVTCPNTIYVASTRSTERLTVFHHYKNDYFCFIAKDKIPIICNQIIDIEIKLKKKESNKTNEKIRIINKNFNVTEFLNYLPFEIIDKAHNFLKTKLINNSENKINIPSFVKQNNLIENVSDITGTIIPAYYEYILTKQMTILNFCLRFEDYIKDNLGMKHLKTINELRNGNMNIEKLLKTGIMYCSIKSKYNFKLNQITNYDWLSETQLNNCVERLKDKVSSDAKFEKNVENTFDGILFKGFIDCIDRNKVWEFKCVSELKKEHFIQLAIYAYMIMTDPKYKKYEKYKFYLYNILTNECHQIIPVLSDLEKMIKYLIDAKNNSNIDKNDIDFLNYTSNKIKHKYPFGKDKCYKCSVVHKKSTKLSYINVIDKIELICDSCSKR